MEGKLSSTQAALGRQEEILRQSEREHKALLDKVAVLERTLQAADSERRAAQVSGGWQGAPWAMGGAPL